MNKRKVGVFHFDLSVFGGGEVVCMQVLKALENDFEIELVTATPEVNLNELAEFAGTDCPDITIRSPGTFHDTVNRFTGDEFSLAQIALFNRVARSLSTQYDIVISTENELSLPKESIQYIHVPQFDRRKVPGEHEAEALIYDAYKKICRWISGWDKREITSGRLIANSEWTANVTESIYGEQPDVIYPPINTSDFNPLPWHDRKNGFVSIGRLEPSKNIIQSIEIIDALNENGHQYQLHIVGPYLGTNYSDSVIQEASSRPHVNYEGTLDREDLIELLCKNKYGLHGKHHEHFGMVVAEMVCAGMIPFIPNSGGQKEIVGNCGDVMYSDKTDAVEKITRVIENENLQYTLPEEFLKSDLDLSVERFRSEIRSVIQ